MLDRTWIVLSVVSISALPALAASPGPPSPAHQDLSGSRPHIVFILADDLGWSDIGAYGSEIRTPHLDALARNGIRFTRFHNTSKCHPSRAALLTGVYAQQNGFHETHTNTFQRSVTLAEVLRAAGYRTLTSGKHHTIENPFERGFDRAYGLLHGATNYFNPGIQRSGEPTPAQKQERTWIDDGVTFQTRDPDKQSYFPKGFYATDAFTDRALAFLDEYKNDAKPFFLYLAYTAPHDPLQAPAREIRKYRGRYDAGYAAIRRARYRKQIAQGLVDPKVFPLSQATHRDWRRLSRKERANEARRMEVYAAMIDRLDQNVGRLVAKLKALGKLDDTIIMFASDNGASGEVVELGAGPIGTLGRWTSLKADWANVSNTPFRLYKNHSYQGGIGSPLIVHWPRGIRARGAISHYPLHLVDVMPTVVDLAQAAYPTTFRGERVTPLQGISFLPLLHDRRPPARTPLFFEWGAGAAVIDEGFKLVRHGQGAPWQLFDLENDATETADLASKRPELAARLAARWAAWKVWANQPPPVVRDDAFTLMAGQSQVIDVLTNDEAAAGRLDRASLALQVLPGQGVLTVRDDGRLTYQHTGARGTDMFVYTVRDEAGALSHRAKVKLTIR